MAKKATSAVSKVFKWWLIGWAIFFGSFVLLIISSQVLLFLSSIMN